MTSTLSMGVISRIDLSRNRPSDGPHSDGESC